MERLKQHLTVVVGAAMSPLGLRVTSELSSAEGSVYGGRSEVVHFDKVDMWVQRIFTRH